MLVFRAGCSYRTRLEGVLAARGVVGARLMEFGTLDGILGCVAAGVGATLLPRSVVEAAGCAGRVEVSGLPGGEGRVETVMVSRREGHVGSSLAAFVRTVLG